MHGMMEEKRIYWEKERQAGEIGTTASSGAAACVNGMAGDYPCSGVDLLAFVSLNDLGSQGQGNDIWGWTDSNGNEYAIAGCSDGSSFVDVTDPYNPVVLGFLPTTTVPSSWRDMKVYKNYAFIGAEAKDHGLQVFDLSQLTELSAKYRENPIQNRNINSDGHIRLNTTFAPSTLYTEFGNIYHNLLLSYYVTNRQVLLII
jgi:choice-of-anchor B domain-containing protein